MAYTYCDELFSDLHKDAHGVRPGERGYAEWDASTPEQKQAWWDHLVESSRREDEYQQEREAKAVAEFEATVARLLSSGAKTRAQAVRWLVDAEDCENDLEYFCYRVGLPYGYFTRTAKAAA